MIPFLGRPHRIEHRPAAKGGVWREPAAGGAMDAIVVTGGAEHLPRRLTDWLKLRAQAVLEARTRAMALGLGRGIGRGVAAVYVRDTRSRWGSCARDGRVHYSWRLIFAPDFVLDYVVAHEVAHPIYMSHGPRFRATVDRLTQHRGEAEAWLRVHAALGQYALYFRDAGQERREIDGSGLLHMPVRNTAPLKIVPPERARSGGKK